VRDLWLTVIAISIIPAAAASFILNPLVFLILGPDARREHLRHLHPFRWWIAASLVALAVATTIYNDALHIPIRLRSRSL
jgi:hypothetical protein